MSACAEAAGTDDNFASPAPGMTALTPTPLEIAESIYMLRVLEHGMQLRMIPTRYSSHAVDTPQDLELVARLMSEAGEP